jgi:hypothetical protein
MSYFLFIQTCLILEITVLCQEWLLFANLIPNHKISGKSRQIQIKVIRTPLSVQASITTVLVYIDRLMSFSLRWQARSANNAGLFSVLVKHFALDDACLTTTLSGTVIFL